MGLVALRLPSIIAFSGSAPAYTSQVIDASGEKCAFVIRCPRAGTLDKFEFSLGTVVQAPTNGLKCSFQDVSAANGDPDGTADQFRTVTTGITTNAWFVPGLITSDGTDTGTKRTVAEGELLACVVEFASFSAGDSLGVRALTLATASAGAIQQHYVDLFTASWAKQSSSLCVVALKYTDSPIYDVITPDIIPASGLNAPTFNSNSSPDERGLIFRSPMSCAVSGFLVRYGSAAAGRNADFILYDSDGTTALKTVAIDGDQVQSTSARWLFIPLTQNLTADLDYRAVIKPSSTSSVELQDFDVSAQALLDACGGGQNWHYTERTDAGSWTQTTTKRPWIVPVFSKFHDDSYSGQHLYGSGLVRAS
jgi:hypothetical protein